MFKNISKLLCIILASIFISKYAFPMAHQEQDPRIELRKSPILQAKLLLDKTNALKQSIKKGHSLYFEIMIEKLQQFKQYFGTLSPEDRKEILQFIKKERNSEKNKCKTFSTEDKLSIAKKGTALLGALAFFCFIILNYDHSPVNDIFSAIYNQIQIGIGITNMFAIFVLSAATIIDLTKAECKFKINSLKEMKKMLKIMN